MGKPALGQIAWPLLCSQVGDLVLFLEAEAQNPLGVWVWEPAHAGEERELPEMENVLLMVQTCLPPVPEHMGKWC